MSASSLHLVPRRPHAWAVVLAVSQVVVVALWWWLGWGVGLAAMLATHAVFLWGVMKPGSAMFSPVLSRLPTQRKVVWLTIDDGPSADTAAILDLLDAHGARATFFVVGERVQARPGLAREIVRRGHGIGNHSHSHPQAWFWALGPSTMRAQVARAQAVIEQATGQAPQWFRAVVGMANPFVAAPLRELGLARVAWSARGFDAVAAEPEAVVARVQRDLSPGAIILMHEGARHGRNVEALALLLQRLDEAGYRTMLPEDPAPAAESPPM